MSDRARVRPVGPLLARLAGVAALAAAAAAGCGRQGPPLPPLPARPAPPGDLQVRQEGGAVWIALRLPRTNLDGTPARIEAVRLVRRIVPFEDSRPERRSRLEREFARSGEIVAPAGEAATDAGLAPADARMQVPDPDALRGWERGLLIAYRAELRAAGSDRWIPSTPAFLEPAVGLGPPGAPRAEAGPEGIALSWEPPSLLPEGAGGIGGLSYNVYRRAAATGPPDRRNARPLTGREFRDSIPQEETAALLYTVRAVLPTAFGIVESADSDVVKVEIGAPAGIDPPSGLTAVSLPGGIRLAWIPPGGAIPGGYRVYRRAIDEAGFEPIAELSPSEVMFHDASVRTAVRYRYRVVAFSASNPERESGPAEVEAETGPSAGAEESEEEP